jgi:hypothetical protein
MARGYNLPRPGEPADPEWIAVLHRIERTAFLLDSRYCIPWTNIHFGWDPIIGIAPVVGDLLMAGVSAKLIYDTRQLGADNRLIKAMALNVAIDAAIGLVPLIGPVFDLAYRANIKNLKLLVDDIERQRRSADP